MAKNEKLSKEAQDQADMEKMQKRVETMLPSKADIPASISIQQAEELKARINELEEKLSQKQADERANLYQASNFNSQLLNQTTVSETNLASTEADDTVMKKIKRFFSAPTFPQDEDKTRRARLLHVILAVQTYIVILAIASTLFDAFTSGKTRIPELSVLAGSFLIIQFWRFLMWRGNVSVASAGLIIAFTLGIASLIAVNGTIQSAGVIYFPLTVVMAVLLISKRAGIVAFVAVTIIGTVIAQFEVSGLLGAPNTATNVVSVAVALITGMGLSLALLYLATQGIENALQRANEDEQALRALTTTLELRVADRTHDMELAAEVGRTIAEKVENISVVLTDATEMIRSRFNLYYTQVYLMDASGQTITLQAGTGSAGRQLLQRGHHLLVNSSSLNGRAVAEKKPVIVADTEASGTFLPNPLLPKTRSEMAIPLIVGDKVLGVLDMQSDFANALNEDNVAAFQVLAGQLSVAIQNATLFAQSEEARKQVEDAARQVGAAGWQDYLNGIERGEKIGYVFDLNEVKPIPRKSKTKSENALSVPITVTGATVGSIQVIQEEREWTSSESEMIQSTAVQLAQHIENLRLLSQAEKYRQEAEQTTRRLTREGWEDYLETRKALATGYSFNPNEVISGNESIEIESASAHSVPIKVRDEAIGELMINVENIDHEDMSDVFSAVAAQLGDHIENLRLFEETEISRLDIQKSQEQYELAVSGSNDGIWDWDLRTNAVYFSPRWKAMVGYNEDELMNGFADFESLLHPDDHDMALNAVNDYLIKKINTYDIEFRFRHKDGSYRWIRARGTALRNPDGTPYRMAGSHSDITQSKSDGEILAQRANQLETVATVSSTAATVLDPDKLLQAVVDLTKERFNVYHTHIYLADDSWNTLLLAAGAGEIGRQMVETGHAIQMDAEKSLVARASRERKSIIVNDVRGEAGFLPNPMLPDTRAEIAVPMIAGDKVIGVFDVQALTVGSFTEEDANIYTTLASQVAVALQNARLYVEQAATVTQLRELDRLKSSFLANMSHELRTPLNSILGFADVMLEGLDGPLTDYMTNDLGLIQKNGQHLLHLINDVLDMAKIDSGKMNLNVEKFNVHELFTDVISITSSLAKEKALELIIEQDTDYEVEINADKIRLRQVMINLVNNAMKFTESGTVTLRATRENQNVLISVKDTGIGIPLDHLEAVFQEFTQVDTTTTRKAGGTGLGLPISRRLINMHSGRLWAESTGVNGEGSTFYVYLPIEANINENATLTAK